MTFMSPRITRSRSGRMSQQPVTLRSNSSPPRTPPSANGMPVKRAPHPRPSVRETFLDDFNHTDHTNSSNESGDERDPHDLSLSPKHAARTSIVDNMLLSLDQFATSNSSVLDDYRLFNSAFESDNGHGRASQDSMAAPRHRGHTFSSSLSSEADFHYDDAVGRYVAPQGRTRRSTSSSNYHSSLRRFGSARSPDSRPARGHFGDGRTPTAVVTASGRAPRKGSKGSATSNIDFGPSLSRRRAESADERRSASFDYGSRPPFVPFAEPATEYHSLVYHDFDDDDDDDDAAPTPSVPAGPRKHLASSHSEYAAAPTHQSSRTPVVSRRNSVKSSKTNPGRKPRPENIGTGIMKGRDQGPVDLGDPDLDLPPPIPGAFDPPAPSPTISFNKPTFPAPPPPEPAPPKERPGFFRRVFGSSKTSTPAPPENAPSEASLPAGGDPKAVGVPAPEAKTWRQPTKASTTGTGSAREGAPQVVNKKPSFFRRRKRSVVESAPPPIVLPQDPGPRTTVDPPKLERSPASSLREVMNPYLGEGRGTDSPEAGRPGAEKLESKKSGALLPQTQRESVLGPADARPRYSLYPVSTSHGVYDTSFLAGNSSGDDDRSSDVDPVSAAEPNEERNAAAGRDPPAMSNLRLTPQDLTGPSLSPVVESFSQKSISPVDGPERRHSQFPGPGESDAIKSPSDSVPYGDAHNDTRPLSASMAGTGGGSSPGGATSEISKSNTASNTRDVPSAGPPATAASEGATHAADQPTADDPADSIQGQARKLFDSQDEVVGNEPAAAWLGDPDRAATRKAYMDLFDFANLNILAALRTLCNRLVLKGETQQVDRVLDAFSTRWCQCNPNHGFKAADVVHTICYSLLLLNTDLHLADIEQKMTKNQFVRNTIPTVRRVAADATPDPSDSPLDGSQPGRTDEADLANSAGKPTNAPAKLVNRLSRTDLSIKLAGDPDSDGGPLVSTPFYGSLRAWEQQVETVLRDFYTSIQKQRLPLFGAQPENGAPRGSSNALLGPSSNSLRRSPSTVSKSGSDIYPRGRSADSRYGTARWSSKPRSRGRLYPPSTMGSSRTSLDDQSSLWSPSGSSTWSKYSLGKLTSVSVDSFGSEYPRGDYQQSIGFANALSQAIIREDSAQSITSMDDPERTTPLLEDETLQLAGAPWAKEGSLTHKHHLDSVDKRAKDRNWGDCFAVIQQGWMRLFSFNTPPKSGRQKSRQRHPGGVVVGGGNWTENAEETWKFLLRQTIASALPPPGYSKSRPHVWALSLPTGAVHLFQAGTPEIVREFVSSANYWSARLSKEPLIGGVSNIEYGWSDAVINSALIDANRNTPPSSSGARPSIQSSIRSSIDQQGGVRPRLPADRVHISDWAPPQQSMMASTLTEDDQFKALQAYVRKVEEELQRHNELRSAMVLAFSPRHPNGAKAMVNWERKSAYLLREIVKFRTYIDSLQGAVDAKTKIYASREEPAEAVPS